MLVLEQRIQPRSGDRTEQSDVFEEPAPAAGLLKSAPNYACTLRITSADPKSVMSGLTEAITKIRDQAVREIFGARGPEAKALVTALYQEDPEAFEGVLSRSEYAAELGAYINLVSTALDELLSNAGYYDLLGLTSEEREAVHNGDDSKLGTILAAKAHDNGKGSKEQTEYGRIKICVWADAERFAVGIFNVKNLDVNAFNSAWAEVTEITETREACARRPDYQALIPSEQAPAAEATLEAVEVALSLDSGLSPTGRGRMLIAQIFTKPYVVSYNGSQHLLYFSKPR